MKRLLQSAIIATGALAASTEWSAEKANIASTQDKVGHILSGDQAQQGEYRNELSSMIDQTLLDHPEFKLSPGDKEIMIAILSDKGFKAELYKVLKDEFAFSTFAITMASIFAILYFIAYSWPLWDGIKNKYLNWKSYAAFGSISGWAMWLNGFVPASIVYAESFLFAFICVALRLNNVRRGIAPDGKRHEKVDTFARFAEEVPYPISSYTPDWDIGVWNKAMEEITGYSAEFIRNHIREQKAILAPEEHPYIVMNLLYRRDNLQRVHEYLEKKKATGAWYTEVAFTMTTKSGEDKTLIWTTLPSEDGWDRRIARELTDADEKQRELEKVRKFLEEDTLTKARSRRTFDEDVHHLLSHHERHTDNGGMFLIIIDIDNFKFLNDSEGHKRGDQILIDLSAFMQKHLRKEDRFYRIGGDEFAIKARANNMEGLIKKLNALRHDFYVTTGVGTSWGIVSFNPKDYPNDEPNNPEKSKELFEGVKEDSDRYMYAVKYYRLINNELIASGRVGETDKEKNGIAIPMFDQDKKLIWVRVQNEYGSFIINPEELIKIDELRKKAENVKRKTSV